MSSPGSSFGWVFPLGQSKQQISDEAADAFGRCGYSVVRKPSSWGGGDQDLEICAKPGLPRRFRFLRITIPDEALSHGQVLYTDPRSTSFRPMDLDYYPESLAETQADYDLAKRIFDLTSATECFGFHNSQDNAVVFEDSNLDFFFMKKGVQLALVHLEERRSLLSGEWKFVASCDAEYEPFRRWDQLLHSRIFTRFSEDAVGKIIRVYDVAQRLIESDWKDYYDRTN